MSIVLNGGQGPVINGDTPDVGLANPMSATGDLIVGGASGAATRLPIGSTGYVPRVVGGTVAWRELSAAGLLADRPAAAAGREGQRYYATDAAAGLELSECVHKGGATYAWEVVSYGVTATGVALTQAASATAGLTALGVQDGPRLIPLFGYATADSATPAVQALAGFTPADYAITGRTTVLTLDAIGSVTGAGLTGTLEILDSGGTVVASIDWTETTPTRKTDAIALPVGAEIYRARVSCTGVTDPVTEYALLGGASLSITWS